jgi:hypothetical protein
MAQLAPGPTRIAQDIGIALLFGGNLFGRRAMHPALEWVSSPEERGKVVNEAWRRYGVFNSVGLAGIVGGWALERSGPLGPRDVAVAAVAVTGVASAIEGVRFGRSAPGGAVPLESGSEPSPAAPEPAARSKRLLNALGQASALAELALLVTRQR